MRVGFIGTGSMGSILLESFMSTGALHPDQVICSNRTREKALRIAENYPGLCVASNNIQVVREAEVIFLCVKPLEFKKVFDEVGPYVKPNHLIISITSPILLADLEKQLPCSVAKIIPSITNSVQAGASLMMFGSRCSEEERQLLRELFSKISTPLEIDESNTRVSSDIVSCGPAFMSYLLQRFISAAVEETGISREQATFLASHMIVGLADLISKGPFDLETLQQRVVVPGGVTGAGLQALENIGDVFNQVFINTHRKYHTDLEEVAHMFYHENK
ncbi:late competence protein ComER [Ammoniphilus sp. CFH 90114]|uniref:late competence protein ComER n=1 Tax=Ammoniphilus sp. CFH 90114 TaxID=2493665 RepID=UPI00100EDAD6|nr:late competence protein ComER [Ammoniphilus sp. CFH 90114]RXT14795.1 late competence protein ComER [Ammoniphilus sp. CFH 90114]